MKWRTKVILGATGLLFIATVRGQSQTNIVMQMPIIAADQTVKIKWSAETGAVYQVQSADSLTGVGSQGLQWIIREAACASKGNHAEWMDVGDPLWLSPILPPRFRQMRFYRVAKVGQATLAPSPTVTMQLTQTNAIIGDLYAMVNVTLNDTNQQVSSVSLFVDGQKLRLTISTNFTGFINSCEWPNGPHEIYAVATTVDAGETLPDCDGCAETNSAKFAISVSPSVSVTFSNYISQLFVAVPFFDPDAGQTQEVVASFPEQTCWRLTVLDYQDSEVRHFTNTSSSLYVAWDGNDDSSNPLPFGFYDYLIEARPAQFGCPPSGMAAMEVKSDSLTASEKSDYPSTAIAKAGVYSRAAMRFSRRLSNIFEDVKIPSLNPSPPPSQTCTTVIPERVVTYCVSDDGTTNKLINGLPAVLFEPFFVEEVSPLSADDASVDEAEVSSISASQNMQAQVSSDITYSTRTPTRVAGTLFMGQAGYVGVGYQGHHPSSPNFALPSGGVISVSHPPYGKLANASVIANQFADVMAASAWRSSFRLGDDNFNSLDLFPVQGPGSGTSTYATKCHFGLYVGHMTATANIDQDCACLHSWIPIYNSQQPGAYQWIGLPFVDLGNGSSPLKWMALYGCNSLQEQDWNDMWTKFVLPMPPNLRLLLGAEEGVFIHPVFGWQFAADMNGLTTPNNVPMTILESWYDAARVADQQTARSLRFRFTMGTRRMTVAWRDNFFGGNGRTVDDSIWNWDPDISTDWLDIYLDERQVYP
jgi:Family of unknown function (DUF6345)